MCLLEPFSEGRGRGPLDEVGQGDGDGGASVRCNHSRVSCEASDKPRDGAERVTGSGGCGASPAGRGEAAQCIHGAGGG